jgi:hypothetical protein
MTCPVKVFSLVVYHPLISKMADLHALTHLMFVASALYVTPQSGACLRLRSHADMKRPVEMLEMLGKC